MNLHFRSDKTKADGTIAVYHINRIQDVLGHQKLAKGHPLIRYCAMAFTIPNQKTEVIDRLGP